MIAVRNGVTRCCNPPILILYILVVRRSGSGFAESRAWHARVRLCAVPEDRIGRVGVGTKEETEPKQSSKHPPPQRKQEATPTHKIDPKHISSIILTPSFPLGPLPSVLMMTAVGSLFWITGPQQHHSPTLQVCSTDCHSIPAGPSAKRTTFPHPNTSHREDKPHFWAQQQHCERNPTTNGTPRAPSLPSWSCLFFLPLRVMQFARDGRTVGFFGCLCYAMPCLSIDLVEGWDRS